MNVFYKLENIWRRPGGVYGVSIFFDSLCSSVYQRIMRSCHCMCINTECHRIFLVFTVVKMCLLLIILRVLI